MSQQVVPRRKPNGRYELRWRENGVRRGVTVDGKAVADRMATKLNARLQTHGLVHLDQGTITLAEFVETYWRNYAVPNLAPKTREVYKRVWAKHLHPRVGHESLRNLTPKRLSRLRAELERDGVGDPTILKAFTMLQGLLSYAVLEDELERNAAREVRKPRQERGREITVPTPEQVETIRAYLLDPPPRRDRRGRRVPPRHPLLCLIDATIVSLLAYGGARTFSEISRLAWPHIGAKSMRVYASKTRRLDVVPMLAPLTHDLGELRTALGRPARGPVIPRPDGQPLIETDWRNWRRRIYRPAATKAGLDGSRPYDLRHAFASILIWEGRSVAEVARLMRNSVATCARTYVHVLEEYDPARRVSAEEQIRRAREKSQQGRAE